jgi:hypothetical protein
MVFVMSGSICTSQYAPKGVLQCSFALSLCLDTSSLGLYFSYTPDFTGKEFIRNSNSIRVNNFAIHTIILYFTASMDKPMLDQIYIAGGHLGGGGGASNVLKLTLYFIVVQPDKYIGIQDNT